MQYTTIAAAGALALLASATASLAQGAFPPIVELGDLLSANGGNGREGFALTERRSGALGTRVRQVGDINNDGLHDFAVCENAQGGCFVYFGRDPLVDGGFPADQAVELLFPSQGGDGSEGFAVVSPQLGGNSLGPSTVAGAGDLNGDGIDDLIIGEPVSDGLGRRSAGVVFVLYGRASFPGIVDLRLLLPAFGGDGSEGFSLHGALEDESAGTDVALVGDVNGDGRDDLLIGAPSISIFGGRGRAYLVFGRDTPPGGVAFDPIVDLRSLYAAAGGDGSMGAVFVGENDTHLDGETVDRLGDFNGDGINDLLIDGSTFEDVVYVVYGRDVATQGDFPAVTQLTDLSTANGGDGSTGIMLQAAADTWPTPRAAGDVNGDGLGDIIIGTAGADPDGLDRAGSVFVFFGRDGAEPFPGTVELERLRPANGGDGSAGFVLDGRQEIYELGDTVAGGGDLNGDGVDDIVLSGEIGDGLDGAGRNNGDVYVVYGRLTAQVGNFPAQTNVAAFLPENGGDGSAGFVAYGPDLDDHAGQSLDFGGDFNHDGLADLIIGASGNGDLDFFTDPGRVFVLYGRSGTP